MRRGCLFCNNDAAVFLCVLLWLGKESSNTERRRVLLCFSWFKFLVYLVTKKILSILLLRGTNRQ